MANVLANIAGFIGGPINAALGLVSSTMQAGFKAAIQYHKEGIAFARDVGLSAQQAQAYTKVLIERTQELANTYGVSSEAIMQIQRGITEATGKQILLNNAQAESFVQIDKMMGAQSRAKFTEEIMNGMGGQVDTVTNAMAKVYATAAKQGLNAKKLSDKVAQNLSMANRLSFRNGIDGITRMAAMSEKLGFNMKSVESAAEKFLDLDKAIENAAQLQMLGGSAAVSFGNPLTAAYEANYDPEAFAKRMTDSLASYATFDAKSGVANVNGMNMDFVRAIGQVLGIGTEEATRIAKKQSEVRYKENKFMPQLISLGLSEDQKNFIINNAQVTNGGNKLELNGKDVRQLTQADLASMMQFEGKSDRDILEQQAKSLISIDEQITGASTKVAASFGKGVDKHIPTLRDGIYNLGEIFSKYAEKWGDDVGILLGDALSWIKQNKEGIAKFINTSLTGITSALTCITSAIDWLAKIENKAEAILMAIIGWGFYKSFANYLPKFGGGTHAGAPASGKPSSPNGGGGGGGAKPNVTNLNGGGPRGGAQVVSKPDGNYFNHGGNRYREVNGEIQQRYTKKGKESWKPVHKNQANSIRDVYNQKLSSDTAAKASQPQGANPAVTTSKLSIGQRALGGAKTFAKSSAPAAAIIAGLQAGASIYDYWGSEEEIIKDPNYTKEEKKQIINAARKNVSSGVGGAAGGFLGAIGGGAAAGAALGTIVPGAGNLVGAIVGTIGGAAGYWLGSKVGEAAGEGVANSIWDLDDKELNELLSKYEKHANGGVVGAAPKVSIEKHDVGGVVGGNSYSGDKILAGLNSGEAVVTPKQFNTLFSMADSIIKAKPVGEKEYIYIPSKSETSNVNGNTITVKDFNINLSGTLKLDGGNNSKNVDINSLLNDHQFINNLKELIKTSINNDMNGGRYMNDLATMRGMVSPSSII